MYMYIFTCHFFGIVKRCFVHQYPADRVEPICLYIHPYLSIELYLFMSMDCYLFIYICIYISISIYIYTST